MKKRFLALLCCVLLAFSIIPTGGNVKAAQPNPTKAKQLKTPEQMAEVIREKANKNIAKMKGKVTQAQANETVKEKLIVKTSSEITNTYGANSVYYYTVGDYQILFYDTAKEAEEACKKIKEDLKGTTVFQDIPIALKEAAKDDSSDEVAAYDGIKKMGLDQLKEQKESWKNKSAKVAVIDSGINVDHQWFKNRLDRENSVNLALDKGNTKDETKPEYNDTEQGHGSHVAGIITQATPDEVQIMAIRVFSAIGTASYATITNAVDYAVEHKADVINMSLGFEIMSGFENDQITLMDEAFARAYKAKVTVCAASGNEYTDTSKSYPASSPWTIAVGSFEPDANGNLIRSDFANNGELLDFVAPGRNISSAWINGEEATNTISGTSMATPHMAAAAAYVKMKHPDYNQRDVYAAFKDNAVDLGEPGKDTEFGYGYVHLENYNTNEAAESKDGKEYQAISAPAQINKTMNDSGESFTIDATVTRGDGNLTYESSNEKIATVKDGKVTIVGRGKCNIIIKASETEKYKETEEKVTIKVDKGYQKIQVPVTSYKKYVSDKSFKLQAYVAKPGDGKVEFIANENDVIKVSKDGEVTILGPGTAKVYAVATSTTNFNRDISDAIEIIVEEDKKNNVDNTTTATQNTTTAAQNATTTAVQDITTATQKVTKISVPKIVMKKINSGKKKIAVSWKRQTSVTGYQLRYSTKANMKKAKLIKVNGKAGNKTIKKLKAKKRYYVQIRAYKNNGQKNIYGKWSTKKAIKTK